MDPASLMQRRRCADKTLVEIAVSLARTNTRRLKGELGVAVCVPDALYVVAFTYRGYRALMDVVIRFDCDADYEAWCLEHTEER